MKNDVDWLLAKAQVGIISLFSIGFFSVLFFLMVYHKDMTSTEVTILTGLLSSLATIIALQQNFMFARTRPAALPDPPTTTTSTTTTAADGSTTAKVVASPLPLTSSKESP